MRKQKRIIVISTILAIFVSIWMMFGLEMLGAFILQSEKIGLYELSVMFNCRYKPEKELTMDIGEEKYIIPLPPNSAKFENDVYPVNDGSHQYISCVRNLEDYFKELSKNGWVVEERMGASYIIKNVNTGDQFIITVNKFTRYYYRFKFS
ncbi:MAG: hypothetical protein GXX10_01530 [Clostridiaceae bacterium]|nr:hypothetical protein [Clostridiaceae bacterium]